MTVTEHPHPMRRIDPNPSRLTQALPLPRSAAAQVLREAAAEYFQMAETAVDPVRYLILASGYHARALKLEMGISGEAR